MLSLTVLALEYRRISKAANRKKFRPNNFQKKAKKTNGQPKIVRPTNLKYV